MNCYELRTIDPINGNTLYYYFSTWQTIRNAKKLAKPIPDKIRILVEDREESLVTVELIDPLKYFYRKFLKNPYSFWFGYRVNWEKEEI